MHCKIKVNEFGDIYIYDNKERLHSFLNEPAIYTLNYTAWYYHGKLQYYIIYDKEF